MSDIFDLFGEESLPDKKVEGVPVVADPGVDGIDLRDLVNAVQDLFESAKGFKRAPDLSMVAMAVQDILDTAGYPSSALAASRWAQYELSGRRSSKIEEARSRADALYRLDLTTIEEGSEPILKTEASDLLWRSSKEPTNPKETES